MVRSVSDAISSFCWSKRGVLRKNYLVGVRSRRHKTAAGLVYRGADRCRLDKPMLNGNIHRTVELVAVWPLTGMPDVSKNVQNTTTFESARKIDPRLNL